MEKEKYEKLEIEVIEDRERVKKIIKELEVKAKKEDPEEKK